MKIKVSPLFRRQYKKMQKKHYPIALIKTAVQAIVVQDTTKLQQLRDHALTNNWAGFRELHPTGKNDNWIMIYNITEEDELVLTLIQTGNHDVLNI
ncbi:MAG: type II toxin-antitoxin system YafQ family toxin [Levilactobacillus sp.]|jgi:mRNA interferase YafQ|uniref:type II toxin-antitoxin system RelE/ParE family toxin n=1 Tax=Levilactobacillus sp. TaxID=2767919 RepID=UPI00258C5D40|nr:type II toxin-antitoxin system YafQ family toxin [Levilactobacillus sp.]MCI1553009.1 type II toxin-antitoxin system YafQ family toxin [Levilactobacillus sp.]MCI1598150.1 type II toxin-antitoxin system YafQ family toxin [Levilactobacillus sp.]MCI1605013.1 type II toxin-antitoxin system YafQ family toxin [Levilactobacillus sp.]